MKKILTVAVLFIAAASLQAQPLPYYQDAYNESGEDLREALYDIIKVHTRLSYSSSSTDTWDVLKVSPTYTSFLVSWRPTATRTPFDDKQ